MITKLTKTFLLFSVMTLLFSCSNTKTSVDYDNSVDFSSLKTYQWDTQPATAFSKSNPLVAKRIVSAIENGLHKKGILKAKSADIKVSYQVNVEKKLSSSNISAGVGMSVGGSGRGRINLSSGNQVKQITEGTLLIDMTSTVNNSLIWRAAATQQLTGQNQSPEESQENINQIVADLFEKFPPNK